MRNQNGGILSLLETILVIEKRVKWEMEIDEIKIEKENGQTITTHKVTMKSMTYK